MPPPRRSYSEPFEQDGVWWVPEEAEVEANQPGGFAEFMSNVRAVTASAEDPGAGEIRAYGPLRFNPDTGLELVGQEAEAEVFAGRRFSVVHGETIEGRPCTLFDALAGSSTAWSAGGARRRLRPTGFLDGVHAGALREVAFSEATLRFDGLLEWLCAPFPGPDGHRPLLTPGRTVDRARPRVEGSSLNFFVAEEGRHERFASETWTRAALTIRLNEALDLDGWEREWISPLADALVLFNKGSSELDGLTAHLTVDLASQLDPAVRAGAPDSVWNSLDVEWVQRRRQPAEEPRERLLLPAAAAEGTKMGFGKLIRRWFALHRELGPVATMWFATQRARGLFVETRLFNALTFAETYHRIRLDDPPLREDEHNASVDAIKNALPKERRDIYLRRLRHANQETQKERVRTLFERAGTVVSEFDQLASTSSRGLVETRNYQTHFSERTKNVLELPDLVIEVERLIAVIEINLLLDLDLAPENIEYAVRSCYLDHPIFDLA